MRRSIPCLIVMFLLMPVITAIGCARMVDYVVQIQPQGDESKGITYYIGGAGPIGHIGSFEVPGGLRDAGYAGYTRVYSWQSWNHAGDQMHIGRNRAKAAELADDIRSYRRRHPDGEINIVALSAGTGIATFALEYLPERIGVNNVVFLACSMSARYDLTRALRRVDGKLYVIYSPTDVILSDVVWYTGTVDRRDSTTGIAGLQGFYLPFTELSETVRQYQNKVVNIPHRSDFSTYGYGGGHIDAIAREFIRVFVARAIMGDERLLIGPFPDDRYAARPVEGHVPDHSTLSNSR